MLEYLISVGSEFPEFWLSPCYTIFNEPLSAFLTAVQQKLSQQRTSDFSLLDVSRSSTRPE
jgi:hypothetical protein